MIKTEGGLAYMICLLVGNEPYLIWNYKNKTKEKIECPEMDLMVSEDLYDENTQSFIGSYPFASNRKCLFLNVENMAALDDPRFYNLLKVSENLTVDILITVDKLEKNRKAYKALARAGCVKTLNKLSDYNLRKFIKLNLEKNGCRFIDETVLEQFVKRVNYYDNEEVSLFTIRNELMKLINVSSLITKKQVEEYVLSNELDNVFILASLMRYGDNMEAVFHELDLLYCKKDFSPISVLSLLLREYRVAWKKVMYDLSKRSAISAFTGLPQELLKKSMLYITGYITDIKNGVCSADNIRPAIQHLMMMMEVN